MGAAERPPFACAEAIDLRLPCRPPYDWAAIRAFLAKRAIPGVETVAPDGSAYRRTVRVAGRFGHLTAEPGTDCLRVVLRGIDPGHAAAVAERLGRLFDCDADPAAIAGCLARDPVLAPLVAARPGLRLPGAWDPFETGCRAILGQQVSVSAAIGLAGRLVAAFGTRLPEPVGVLTHVFPTAADLVEADIALALNMPRARGAAIRALAAATLAEPDLFAPAESLEAALLRFTAIRGIGPWTAQYIALRALKLPDALPVGDVGLLRALETGTGRPSPAELLARAEAWRPFRAYAAQHLWAADEAAVKGR
ncbi:DNA-3-methyladenine glycosylase family protein [Methylobacterium sp. P5_C11]